MNEEEANHLLTIIFKGRLGTMRRRPKKMVEVVVGHWAKQTRFAQDRTGATAESIERNRAKAKRLLELARWIIRTYDMNTNELKKRVADAIEFERLPPVTRPGRRRGGRASAASVPDAFSKFQDIIARLPDTPLKTNLRNVYDDLRDAFDQVARPQPERRPSPTRSHRSHRTAPSVREDAEGSEDDSIHYSQLEEPLSDDGDDEIQSVAASSRFGSVESSVGSVRSSRYTGRKYD